MPRAVRGRGSPLLYAQLQTFFPDVYLAKPKSSRNSSAEAFVVCRGFKLPPNFRRGVLGRITTSDYAAACATDGGGSSEERLAVPFVACGDLSGYDADANYDLPATDGPEGYTPIEPVQMPTTPAYRAYMERQQGVDGRRTVLDEQWSAGAQAPELT